MSMLRVAAKYQARQGRSARFLVVLCVRGDPAVAGSISVALIDNEEVSSDRGNLAGRTNPMSLFSTSHVGRHLGLFGGCFGRKPPSWRVRP